MIFILQNPAADSSFSFPNVKGAYRSDISYTEEIRCKKIPNNWREEGTNHELKQVQEMFLLKRTALKPVWLVELSLDEMMKLLRDEWIVYHANHEISFDPNYPYPTLRINNIY